MKATEDLKETFETLRTNPRYRLDRVPCMLWIALCEPCGPIGRTGRSMGRLDLPLYTSELLLASLSVEPLLPASWNPILLSARLFRAVIFSAAGGLDERG